MARINGYGNMGLGGLISYRGDPEMFLNIALVTFFDIEDQNILHRQRRGIKILRCVPITVGIFFALMLIWNAIKTGSLGGLWTNFIVLGVMMAFCELLALAISMYVGRGWLAFRRWARRYDAHIMSALIGGRRDRSELPGYTALIEKIRAER